MADRQPPPIRELLTLFDELHRARFQVPAVLIRGRDANLMTQVWRQQGDLLTRDLMRDFFALDDPWLDSHGYSVPMFVLRLPALVIARPRRPRAEHWRDECQRLHGGSCHSPVWHQAIIARDRNGGRR